MKIDDFDNSKKIANIVKDDKNPNDLKLDYKTEVKKGEKTTYAKVVNGEVKNIFESSNFKPLGRYFKNHDTIKKQGDKATESNFAKYPLAKADLEQGNKVEIYELEGNKKENLEKYHRKENRYPDENFQANKENIPDAIIKEYDEIKKKQNENQPS